MHEICKEKISKTFLAANFVYVANVKVSSIGKDTVNRHS